VNELMIETTDLTKQYGHNTAVSRLTMRVRRGEVYGFLGPNGAGKTTTIRLLTGITAPSAGEVAVFGSPPTEFTPDDRARIGYLPQLSVLFPTLSLLENLHFVASIYGMPLRRSAEVRAALDFVDLWEERHKRLRDASGGMQRRLALAAALVHSPRLLFLDEPTAGIDPVLRRRIWDRVRELRDGGRTLFITTQYVSEAEHCDLVGVLDQGRLVVVDTPEGLRRRAFGGELLDTRARQPFTVAALDELRALPEVVRLRPPTHEGGALRLVVEQADRAIPRVTDCLERHGIAVESVQQVTPGFDEVFVLLVGDGER
jgi:ABC-2 type transport system ATP-binding protein